MIQFLWFSKIKEMIREQSIAGVRLLTLHPLEEAIPFYQAQGCKSIYSDDDIQNIEHMYIDVWK